MKRIEQQKQQTIHFNKLEKTTYQRYSLCNSDSAQKIGHRLQRCFVFQHNAFGNILASLRRRETEATFTRIYNLRIINKQYSHVGCVRVCVCCMFANNMGQCSAECSAPFRTLFSNVTNRNGMKTGITKQLLPQYIHSIMRWMPKKKNEEQQDHQLRAHKLLNLHINSIICKIILMCEEVSVWRRRLRWR